MEWPWHLLTNKATWSWPSVATRCFSVLALAPSTTVSKRPPPHSVALHSDCTLRDRAEAANVAAIAVFARIGVPELQAAIVDFLVGPATLEWFNMAVAARFDCLPLLQLLHLASERCPTRVICTTDAMDMAAAHGHLEVVQWLHANRREGYSARAAVGAAAGKHAHVVRWLQSHDCTRSTGTSVETCTI